MKSKPFLIVFLFSSISFAHNEDIFPDNYAIIKRQEYADNLQKQLQNYTKVNVSTSLFGIEMEHLLIISPKCKEVKNYSLTGARSLGILSATCRWYDGQYFLRVQ